MTRKPVDALILDAAPLITQSASTLQHFASSFYTTPGVHAELKDENSRNQLLLWADNLVVRHPKQASIDKVSHFARLTGDYSVLSLNDIHIIALAYEIECEKVGDKILRKYPGEKLENEHKEHSHRKFESKEKTDEPEQEAEDDDGFTVVKKKNKATRKQWRQKWQAEKAQAQASRESESRAENESQDLENNESHVTEVQQTENAQVEDTPAESDNVEQIANELEEASLEETSLQEEYNEDDDDGDWITPENLQEEILKDNNESVQDTQEDETIPVAFSSGDFACQNVAMQLGLRLMNYTSGKQIRRVRNYMYRCHACFTMVPMPKSGQPKHFCPKCGGNTLIRCAVSIDNVTGKVTPHLKANFQWITKGQVYLLASPLSKNSQKQQGNRGYQHNKENRHKKLQDPVILREDQKEYAQALKDDAWQRKKNEKMLLEWIGGGSADNFISPFSNSHKNTGVRVGRGRGANAVKGKRK